MSERIKIYEEKALDNDFGFSELKNARINICSGAIAAPRDLRILNATGEDLKVLSQTGEVIEYKKSIYTVVATQYVDPVFFDTDSKVAFCSLKSPATKIAVEESEDVKNTEITGYDYIIVTPDVFFLAKSEKFCTYSSKCSETGAYKSFIIPSAYIPCILEITDTWNIKIRSIDAPYKQLKSFTYTKKTPHHLASKIEKIKKQISTLGLYVHTIVMPPEMADEFSAYPDIRGKFEGMIEEPRYIKQAKEEEGL